jgi:hypothetical protein
MRRSISSLRQGWKSKNESKDKMWCTGPSARRKLIWEKTVGENKYAQVYELSRRTKNPWNVDARTDICSEGEESNDRKILEKAMTEAGSDRCSVKPTSRRSPQAQAKTPPPNTSTPPWCPHLGYKSAQLSSAGVGCQYGYLSWCCVAWTGEVVQNRGTSDWYTRWAFLWLREQNLSMHGCAVLFTNSWCFKVLTIPTC